MLSPTSTVTEADKEVKNLPAPRAPNGQFAAGVSGNPNGRPLGRKNLITALKQELEITFRDHAKRNHPRVVAILDKLFEMAEGGNLGAAKLILDKLVSSASGSEDDGVQAGKVYIFRIEQAGPPVNSTQPAVDAEFEVKS